MTPTDDNGPMPPLGPEPFVGRTAELGRLMRAFADARSGNGSLILILGDAGAGKTRIIDELASAVSPASFVWGRAVENATVAYRPWRQAFSRLNIAFQLADVSVSHSAEERAGQLLQIAERCPRHPCVPHAEEADRHRHRRPSVGRRFLSPPSPPARVRGRCLPRVAPGDLSRPRNRQPARGDARPARRPLRRYSPPAPASQWRRDCRVPRHQCITWCPSRRVGPPSKWRERALRARAHQAARRRAPATRPVVDVDTRGTAHRPEPPTGPARRTCPGRPERGKHSGRRVRCRCP